MAKGLQRTPLPIKLSGSLDTKSDPFKVDADHLLQRVNVTQSNQAEIRKRAGYVALGSAGFSAPGPLATFNDELLQFGDAGLKSYDNQTDSWFSHASSSTGQVRSPDISLANAYSDNHNQSDCDSATYANCTVIAYTSTLGGVYAVVYDETTGQRLTVARVDSDTGPATYGARPRVVNIGTKLCIVYQRSNSSIYYVVVDPATPTTFTSPAVLIASRMNGKWDVDGSSGASGLGALVSSDGSGNFTLKTFNSTGLTGNSLSFTGTFASAAGAACAFLDNSYIFGATWTGTTLTCVSAAVPGLSSGRAQTNLTTSNTPTNVTACKFDANTFQIVYDVQDPETPYNSFCRKVKFGANNTTAYSDALMVRGAALATRAFYEGTDPLVGVVYPSANVGQSTAFIVPVASGPHMIAKLFPYRAIGLISTLPRVTAISSEKYQLVQTVTNNYISGPNATLSYTTGVGRVVLDFSNERFLTGQLNKNLHIGGASVGMYDGASYAELGFPIVPEITSVVSGGWKFEVITAPKVGTTGSFYLYPPADTAGPPARPSGSQIEKGSYIVLFNSDAAGTGDQARFALVWFRVDGSGSAPSATVPTAYGTGSAVYTTVQVDILSTDNQEQVARKFVSAVANAVSASGASAALPSTTDIPLFRNTPNGYAAIVKCPAPTTNAPTYPTDYSTLTYTIISPGTAAPLPAHVRLVVPSGKFITGGQYFLLHSTNHSVTRVNEMELFYYVVDGVGSAPSQLPPGVVGTYPINIASTDSSQTVGTTTATAIQTATDATSAAQLYDASGGPVVDINPHNAATYGVDTFYQYNDATFFRGEVGGRLTPGSRDYYAVYEWYDAQGNLHRSAPSTPIRVTNGAKISGAAPELNISGARVNNQTNLITITTLRLTWKFGVRVVLYRTQDLSNIAYRIAATDNDLSSDSVSFSDPYGDSEIASSETLYALQGGELPNQPPPSSRLVVPWQGRLMCVDSTDPTALWPSKVAADAYGIAFSNLTKIRVDSSGSPITALAVMDEKLIIFKTDKIMAMVGDGPDNAGQNSNFSTPQVVTTDVGCIEPRSVVVTHLGVMFQSAKGIYLLTRGMEAKYIGWPVESYNSYTVTSAVMLRDQNQVRFTLSGAAMLVYDYVFDTWGTYTISSAKSACIWAKSGGYVVVPSTGAVWRENAGTYTDAGTNYQIKVQTSWLKPAQVAQGFARAYRLLLLGQNDTNWPLQVTADYDYRTDTNFTYQLTPVLTTDYSNGGRLQVRYGLPKQLCESVRFTVEETDPGDLPSVASVLTEAHLEVGVKSGTFKLPGSQTTG